MKPINRDKEPKGYKMTRRIMNNAIAANFFKEVCPSYKTTLVNGMVSIDISKTMLHGLETRIGFRAIINGEEIHVGPILNKLQQVMGVKGVASLNDIKVMGGVITHEGSTKTLSWLITLAYELKLQAVVLMACDALVGNGYTFTYDRGFPSLRKGDKLLAMRVEGRLLTTTYKSVDVIFEVFEMAQ